MTKQKEKNIPPYVKSSPAVLAEQPNKLETENYLDYDEQQEWIAERGHYEARLIRLRAWRDSWWTTTWANLSVFVLPKRSIWQTQSAGGNPTPNNMSRGLPINSAIKNTTHVNAINVAAAGMTNGMASQSKEWFKLITMEQHLNLDDDAREWLDEVENRLYKVLANSNFYSSLAQEIEDLLVFGTAPTLIYEDAKDVVRLYNPVVGEYFLGTSGTMRIDTFYRLFVMTIAEIVDFFQLENCPDTVRTLWAQKGSALDIEYIVAHTIEPNFDGPGFARVPGNFPWREVYWLWGQSTNHPLSKCGMIEQPFTAARWTPQSNDAYGRSPGMDALPDIAQLQVQEIRLAEAIQKQIRPPLLADMTLKHQPSSQRPGEITYVQGLTASNGMRPVYQVMPDIAGMRASIKEVEARVLKILFNDLFLMLNSQAEEKKTAYEIAQLVQEKLQVLGPVIENFQKESLSLKLKRVYSIMRSKGLLPQVPDSLKGVPLDIEFISMLSIAQKASVTGGIERILQLVGNMVAVYPESKYLLNYEDIIREFNDLLANPQKILNSPDMVQKLTQAAQAAQAAAAKQQYDTQHLNNVSTAADSAQTLANTNIGGGQTALNILLSGQQGGAR